MSRRGALLLKAIEQAKTDRGMYWKDVAEELDMHKGELSRLRVGHIDISRLSRERIEKIANFLGVPPLAAMILAETVSPTDFYMQEGKEIGSVQSRIERAVRFIMSDPEWSAMIPKDALDSETGDDWRLFLVWCYEKATGLVLIDGSVDYIELLKQVEEHQQKRDAEK